MAALRSFRPVEWEPQRGPEGVALEALLASPAQAHSVVSQVPAVGTVALVDSPAGPAQELQSVEAREVAQQPVSEEVYPVLAVLLERPIHPEIAQLTNFAL